MNRARGVARLKIDEGYPLSAACPSRRIAILDTMPQKVCAPDALPSMPVFSQAMVSGGMVYVSGNIGCLPDLKTLVDGGVQAQTVRTAVPLLTRRRVD